MKRWIPRLVLGGVCGLALLACAQDSRVAPELTTLRIIVQFKQPVDPAHAALVQTLQDQAQAPVRYLSGVSADTHVYGLQWPPGQSATPVLQRLGALPAVARVELDAPVKAH